MGNLFTKHTSLHIILQHCKSHILSRQGDDVQCNASSCIRCDQNCRKWANYLKQNRETISIHDALLDSQMRWWGMIL